MELNKEIAGILKSHNIDVSQGYLCLLGIYFKLDVEDTCSEATIKAINLTKIVEKDYKEPVKLVWNVPLFAGQVATATDPFDWVAEWIAPFGTINPDRKGSPRDVLSRMKKFFSKYPEYRKEDVFRARDAYFRSLSNAQYLMKSHKFIFDGVGAMEKSTLLEFCEKVANTKPTTTLVGTILQ